MRLTVCTCALFSMLLGSLLWLTGCSSEASRSTPNYSAEAPANHAPLRDSEATPTPHRELALPADESESFKETAEPTLDYGAAAESKDEVAERSPTTPPPSRNRVSLNMLTPAREQSKLNVVSEKFKQAYSQPGALMM